jgi:hypothetical protein
MWSKNQAAKKRHAVMIKNNRSMVAAVTLCAALAVTAGCGDGTGASHGNHAAQTSAIDTNGGHGNHGGHAASEMNDDAGKAESGSAHEGHGAGESAASPIQWSFEPEQPKAGDPFTIKMNMKDSEGRAIEEFDESHEKLMHLIVVSEDLSQFLHLHPTYDGTSGFSQEAVLPEGGEYRLFADYKPAGEEQRSAMGSIRLEGESETDSLVPDKERTKAVNGINVTLAFSSLKAGEESELAFTFEDAANGKAVTDLEPYLGAIGHVVVIGEGAEPYLHVHVENDGGSGPEARFATSFPKPGLYRIWGQFQRNGEPFTVAYTVKAE